MRSQQSTRAKNAQRLSDDVIAKRYLDLQRLRDEVREAEKNCASLGLKKPRGGATRGPRPSVRASDQQVVDLLPRP